MSNPQEVRLELLRATEKLLHEQRFGVLATQREGQPYGNVLCFAATEDLKYLLFTTPRPTRKFANLQAEARAALVVDDTVNLETDLAAATALTAVGTVQEISAAERPLLEERYLSKNPSLREFVSSPNCVFLKLEVKTYFVVRRFQEVFEVHVKP